MAVSLEYALQYAMQGWAVFPLRPGAKTPLTEHGFKEATKDLEQIRQWWTRWPDANVGVVTGKVSGIVVLDVDRKNGVDGVVAATELDLPETLVARTPSGGFHLIFKAPEKAIPRKIGVKPGLDILGEGGYFVAPGSVVNGACYEIVRNRPIADCPQVLLDLSRSEKKAGSEKPSPDAKVVGEGQRNEFLTALGGRMRRIGFDADEMTAALIVINTLRCKPPLSEAEVRRIAASVARYEPDPRAVEDAHKSAPLVTRSLSDLLAADFPPPEFLLDPVLRHPGISLWFGPSGISKTYLVLALALSLASGQRFLRWHPTKPHGVLYVDGELGRADMKFRTQRLIRGHQFVLQAPFYTACFDDQLAGFIPDLEQPENQERFIAGIPEGISVIVIDSLSTVTAMNESDSYQSWTTMQRFLLRLRRLGYSVLVIHHANKSGTDQAGTSRRIHVMESVVSLRKHESAEVARPGQHDVEIHITKGRNLAPEQKEPFIATLSSPEPDAMAWSHGDLGARKGAQIEEMLLMGMPISAIVAELGCGMSYAYRVRDQLIKEGRMIATRSKQVPKKDRWRGPDD